MDKKNIIDICNTLNCEYEIGIWSETEDFLERQINVIGFDFKYEGNMFLLKVKLRDYNFNEAKSLFHSLVRFIEYSSTFYTREEKDDNVEYYLLSSLPSKKAFLFNIVFHG